MVDAPQAVEQVGKEIGDRLKGERARLGYGQAEFAVKVGVSKTTQFNYESGGRSPDAIYLLAAHKLGVRLGYVITGVHAEAQETRFITLPVLSTTQGQNNSGVGEEVVAYGVGGMSVSREWLEHKHLNVAALAATRVRGHAMQGVLSDGDPVVVDTSDTTPQSGYVYVIRQGSELLVRFCQLMPGGTLRVTSANPNFPAYDVDLKTAQDVQIVGRVVASMHEW